jgi:hypothetical protein
MKLVSVSIKRAARLDIICIVLVLDLLYLATFLAFVKGLVEKLDIVILPPPLVLPDS